MFFMVRAICIYRPKYNCIVHNNWSKKFNRIVTQVASSFRPIGLKVSLERLGESAFSAHFDILYTMTWHHNISKVHLICYLSQEFR